MINEAKARLDEWAKHSPPLAYIVECLKQVMTPEIAGWVMKENKSAKGLWKYIEAMALEQYKAGTMGVMVPPPQMEQHIYAYLQRDEKATAATKAKAPEPVEDEDDDLFDTEDVGQSGQMGFLDDVDGAGGAEQVSML